MKTIENIGIFALIALEALSLGGWLYTGLAAYLWHLPLISLMCVTLACAMSPKNDKQTEDS